MYKIKLDPSMMHMNAKKIRGIRTSYDSNINDLVKLVENLDEIWEGKAQKEFAEKFNQIRGTFAKFSEILDKYAADMDFTAREMKNLDELLSKKIDII